MNLYVLIGIKFALGLLISILQITILGKYDFSVNTPLNQIQNYVLGGIIGGVIYNSSISILTFLIVLLVWSFVVIVIKLLVNNKLVKSLVVRNPVVLIKNGIVNVENCARVGLGAEQLMMHLRMEGLNSTLDVKIAIMESNGKLTVIDKDSDDPVFPLISNGIINYELLDIIGYDENLLLESLKSHGIEQPKDVFLAEYINKELHFVTYPKNL